MCWKNEEKYKAKIGGIIYENVKQPIVYNNEPLIIISRNDNTGNPGVSFQLRTQDKVVIATIENNKIKLFDSKIYSLLKGTNRFAVVENSNGRIWCDLRFGLKNNESELDLSCLLFSESGYPIMLHPNRSKFGKVNDNEPPNISFLTITTELGSNAEAIILDNTSLYILDVKIENFYRGVSIVIT